MNQHVASLLAPEGAVSVFGRPGATAMKVPANQRVLVIDDDALLRLMVRECLEQAGFQVVEASNAEDGLAHFEREGCELVLVDLLLPGMNGHQACERLRSLPDGRNLPIIVMTGRDDRESIDCAYDSGATDFVTKPIVWDLLPYKVRYALRSHRTLRDSLQHQTLLAHAQRLAHLGSWEWQPGAGSLQCSDEMVRIHGMLPDSVARTLGDMLECVHAEDRDAVRQAMQQALEQRQPYALEFRIVRPDGSVRRVFEQTDVECDARGQLLALRGVRLDITQRVEADLRIRTLAYFDPLTGLPNRSLLREMAQHWLPYAARRGLCSAVLVVDIDRFKFINETLGAPVADEVLKQVGQRLREGVRASDLKGAPKPAEAGRLARGSRTVAEPPFLAGVTSGKHADEPVARLGADEFTVLLVDVGDPDQALRVAQRLIRAIALPMPVQDHTLQLSCSIGVALSPQDGQDADALLGRAGTAMRVAKLAGRDQVRFYDGAMGSAVLLRATLESELKRALDGGEFRLVYQPKVAMREQRVVGSEALMRWQHPRRGLVNPGEFIPVAEDSGLIVPMTHWVIRQVCAQQAAWRAAGLTLQPVSINLAAASLNGDDLVHTVAGALQRHGLRAHDIEFEVTESSLMGDLDRANRVLHALKALGLRIAIDDFGTGYSSLTYLKRFPVDVLKIDRSFVMDIGLGGHDTALTSAIIAMGLSLNLELVAEGVETTAQAEFLLARGCALAQGYLYAKPLAEAAFAEVLARGLALPATP